MNIEEKQHKELSDPILPEEIDKLFARIVGNVA